MNTRKNVRERRNEKIRKLQEHDWRRGFGEPDLTHMHFPLNADPRYAYPDEPGEDQGRFNRRNDGIPPVRSDPEEEWNRKYQREWAAYDKRYPAGGGVADRPRFNRFAVRILLSGLLFAAVWGLYKLDHPWAERGKDIVSAALSEPLDTAALAVWYERYFGGPPSFLPAINPAKHQDAEKVAALPKHYFAPVQGRLIAEFTPEQGGVLLGAQAGTPVSAIDTGMVTFAGEKDDTGFTVVLRHTGGMETVYGHLAAGNIQAGDWLKGGETVGTLAKPKAGQASGTLFFAVSKAGMPLDPSDVITFE